MKITYIMMLLKAKWEKVGDYVLWKLFTFFRRKKPFGNP